VLVYKKSLLLSKINILLSLDVETNTPNGREKAVFSRKDKKKITDISP